MNRLSIVVSVGTDHHRFDRLIDWVERWAARSGRDVDLFVQHGTSRAPSIGAGTEMLSREEMLDRYRDADIVVTQVGPGSILDSAAAGKLPIVVPRRPDLGEHVDGHQIVFGRFMAERGEALLAEDEDTFLELLSRVAADPELVRHAPRTSPAAATARALGAVIDEMMLQPVRFIRWPRFLQVGGHRPARVPAPMPAAPVLVPATIAEAEATPAWAGPIEAGPELADAFPA